MLNKVLMAALLAAAIPAHAGTYPNHWPSVARTDLDFMYHTLRDNHPGAIDQRNPYFKEWLEKGYAAAGASAQKAASLADAKRVLARYAAGFGDMHLQVSFSDSARAIQWPGLIVERIGTRYLVAGRAQGWPVSLPAAGAELVSCDGRTADTLMTEDILPAVYNAPTLGAVKNIFAQALFTDAELTPHQYRSCVFADGGAHKRFDMAWRGISRIAWFEQRGKAIPEVSHKSSITQVAPKTYWIHLPQFSPGPDEEKELKALIARTASLRDAELLIFDTRGNGGGNSQWGDDVLEGLYGAPYLRYMRAKQGDRGYAEYRASQANLDYIDSKLPDLKRQFGAGSDTVRHQAGLVARLRSALASGAPFVRQSPERPPAALPAAAPVPLTRARAVLVTDSDCVSSCLDFADAVRSLPGMQHLGQTTNADTLFMEVRYVDLPSKLGSLVVAQKVYRDRLRANNQPWVPHVEYEGRIHDTEALRPWVLNGAAKAKHN